MAYRYRQDRRLLWFYLLPLAHLGACLWVALARSGFGILPAWMPIVTVDFPVSILLFALVWRFGHPLLWFGVLGTLWWIFLVFIVLLYREANRKRH